MILNGIRIIESPYLEQDGKPTTVRRSWRERLFGRPWRPLVTTKVVVPRIPFMGAVQFDAHTMVMHPAAVKELKEILKS